MTADYVAYDDLPWADEQVIRAYSDTVLKNPGVSPDLLAAAPL